LLLAVDAAGHVKATSGGGIYFSLVAGRLAAEAAGAILGGDAAALPRYEQAWRRGLGRGLVFPPAGWCTRRARRALLGQAVRAWREIALPPPVLRAFVRGLFGIDQEPLPPGLEAEPRTVEVRAETCTRPS